MHCAPPISFIMLYTIFLRLSGGCAFTALWHLDSDERGAVGKFGDDADLAALAGVMPKLDIAVDQSEKRVIAANTDKFAGANPGAALAHNNTACGYQLPIIAFDAEHFGLAVSPVAGTAHSFFMCHDLFLCLAFSIFNAACAAAAAPLLGRSLSLGGRFSCLQVWLKIVVVFLNGCRFGLRRIACNQAFAVGYNIVDAQECGPGGGRAYGGCASWAYT